MTRSIWPLTAILLLAGCSSPDEAPPEDLRRYAADHNIAALEAYIERHADEAEHREEVDLAIDLLAALGDEQALRALNSLVLRFHSSPHTAMEALRQANAHGRPLPDPRRLADGFHRTVAVADSSDYSPDDVRKSAVGRFTVALGDALRLARDPDATGALLTHAREALADERYAQALDLLLLYRHAGGAGSGADSLDALVRPLTEAIRAQRIYYRDREEPAQHALEQARERVERYTRAMPAYEWRRFYVISQELRNADGAVYEVALPDPAYPSLPSASHALLFTLETSFTSSGWASLNVTYVSAHTVQLQEEFGSFNQEWPVYREVPTSIIERRREDLDRAQAELSRLEAEEAARVERDQQHDAMEAALRDRVIADLNAFIARNGES